MQSQRIPSEQRRQSPVEFQRHASERPGRNPKATPETPGNPSHQNTYAGSNRIFQNVSKVLLSMARFQIHVPSN